MTANSKTTKFLKVWAILVIAVLAISFGVIALNNYRFASADVVIGNSVIGSPDTGDQNTLIGTVFTAVSSNTVTDMNVYISTGSGVVMVGLYSFDNGLGYNDAGTLLGNETQTVSSTGWFDFTGFSVALTSGTQYWAVLLTTSSTLEFSIATGSSDQTFFGLSFSFLPTSFSGADYVGAYTYSVYGSSSASPTPTPTVTPTPSPTPTPTPVPTPPPSSNSTFDPPLHCSGNETLNAANQTVLLTGWNKNGYEDYPAGSWQAANGAYEYNVQDNATITANLEAMKADGANFIRVSSTLLFMQNSATPTSGAINTTDISYIQQLAQLCYAQGIYMDLTFRQDIPDESQPNVPYYDSNYPTMTPQIFENIWGNVSAALKSYPNVIFELWNEPEDYISTLAPIFQICINNIRSTGATNCIIVQYDSGIYYDFGAGGGNSGMSWIGNGVPYTNPNDFLGEQMNMNDSSHNLIYSTHVYLNGNFYNSSNSYITDYSTSDFHTANVNLGVFIASAHVPLIIGEIGEDLYDTNTAEQLNWYTYAVNMYLSNNIGVAEWWWYPPGTEYSTLTGGANYALNTVGSDTSAIFLGYTQDLPTYSGLSVSNTTAGASCQFDIVINDAVALQPNGGWIFYSNNTGVFLSPGGYSANFTSTPQSFGATLTLNSTIGDIIAYEWNFTNNAGNAGSTGIQYLTVTSGSGTTYAITATANTGGTISPSGVTNCLPGSSQTYTIAPNIGYYITTVIVDGNNAGALNNFTFTNITTTHTITANFAIYTYTITATADANSQINPNGSTSVNYGSSITFTYSANNGYAISQVLVNGQNTPISSPQGTYTFTNVQVNQTIQIQSIATGTSTPTPTPTPAPITQPTETMQLYFLDTTYNTTGISAYGLDTDYGNTYNSIPLTSNGYPTLTYGFEVFLVSSPTKLTELTSGPPDAPIMVSGNFTGLLSSSWNSPQININLGYQALEISIYASIDNGATWQNQANFITGVLVTNQLEPSTWTFTLQITQTQQTNQTTTTFSFGNTNNRSTINNIIVEQPTEAQLELWRTSRIDIIGVILGPYIDLIGPAFYILLLIMFAGVLYFRYNHAGIIVFFFSIFGGAEGLIWLFVPPVAAAIVGIIIVFALVFTVWRIIR
jgi:hypothetical protein